MPSTGPLFFVLVLASAAGLVGCAQVPADGRIEKRSARTEAAWAGADENETLLYQQAVASGLGRHPDIQKMMVTTLLHEQVYSQLGPEALREEDLRSFFEEQRETFATAARVHLRRILLAPTEELSGAPLEARARALHRAVLKDTDSFASMARDYSGGPYALGGGDVGFITAEGKGGLDPAAVLGAFAMEAGGPPKLVHTPEGWNILWVPAVRGRIEPTFEEVRHSVLRRLRARRHKALHDEYLERLRHGAAGAQ